MQVAVGLGNPGVQYAGTRHNLGFRVVDLLADDLKEDWSEATRYLCSEVVCESRPLLLVKPITYMNDSGAAVVDVMHRFDVAVEDVLVVVDDIHLEIGQIRLRRRGSDGGHNGLRSIIDRVGSSDFPRLRLGVGAPPEDVNLIAHVLTVFDKEELETVETTVRAAADGVVCWLAMGLDAAMNRFNAKTPG